ncbi:MAG TPA: patatin-like phospholipase family protein [Saprospiraceae bacterium]|nr:patatin-like phospholipase family protein [Saprospiraceae bacterium]
MRIGLALSGGGARGMVHVGVIQALTESGITIHEVSGTSAGAIVGSLFAAGHQANEILAFAKEKNLIRILNLRLPYKGFVTHKFLRRQLKKYLPGNSFEELRMPCYITVANLNSGLAEAHSSGPLIDLVVASSSIPILFEPVHLHGNMYVDGGLMKNLHASPLRKTCDFVIGVNLVPQIPVPDSELKTVFGIGGRCFDIAALNNIKPELSQCDIVIEPPEISRYSRFSVSHIDKMYQIGYEETKKNLTWIQDALARKAN